MTVTIEKKTEISKPRQALGLTFKLIYEKYGKEVLPIIEEVCFKLGTADGKRLKQGVSSLSFKEAQKRFLDRAGKSGFNPRLTELTETRRHSKFYGPCVLGLENSCRELCEAAMVLDEALFEAAMGGKKPDLKIIKTLAAGDPYCEISWTFDE